MEEDFDTDSYDEDEAEEEEDALAYVKPVFVPKHLRQSNIQKAQEEEQKAKWEERKNYLQHVKKENVKAAVAEVVRIRENGVQDDDDANSEVGIPNDADDVAEVRQMRYC